MECYVLDLFVEPLLLLCSNKSATGKMAVPTEGSFYVLCQKVNWAWYVQAKFMFVVQALFSICVAHRFNVPYIRYRHICLQRLKFSHPSTCICRRVCRLPPSPLHASRYPLACSAQPPLPPSPCKHTCVSMKKKRLPVCVINIVASESHGIRVGTLTEL
jgi:hypothetical protein